MTMDTPYVPCDPIAGLLAQARIQAAFSGWARLPDPVYTRIDPEPVRPGVWAFTAWTPGSRAFDLRPQVHGEAWIEQVPGADYVRPIARLLHADDGIRTPSLPYEWRADGASPPVVWPAETRAR